MIKPPLLALVWIATWTAHLKYMVPCKPPEPIRDPYTDQIDLPKTRQLQYGAAGSCEDLDTKSMTRKFATREEAEAFKKGCPEGVCSDWKIQQKEKTQ